MPVRTDPVAYRVAALEALRSPQALLAIACLLLNDHVLKANFPSWLTGKLSDFSGIFFFPYLVAVALSFAFSRIPSRRSRALVFEILPFAITGTAFASMKIDPKVAAATGELLGALYGGPALVVPDASDLLALVMLPASYSVFRARLVRPTAADRRHPMTRLLVLGIAAAASIATSRGPVPDVLQLQAHPREQNELYAVASGADGRTHLYHTTDGRNWEIRARGVEADPGGLVPDPSTAGRFIYVGAKYITAVDGAQTRVLSSSVPFFAERTRGDRFVVEVSTRGVILVGKGGTLIRSEDHGETWRPVILAGQIRALRAATSQEGTIYAIVDRVLMRSDDDGTSWMRSSTLDFDANELFVDPRDARLLFVANAGRLLRSDDTGSGWGEVIRGRSGLPDDGYRWTVVFDPHEPDRVYATFAAGYSSADPLYVSADRGRSWKKSDLAARSVGVLRAPEPRIFIAVPERGVYRQTRPWPLIEPWERATNGLPFK